MGKKRGSSHLEMILAFGVFVVSTVFILTLLNPLRSNDLSEITLISLKDNFIERGGTELISIFLNGSCVPTDYSQEYLNSTSRQSFGEFSYVLLSDEFYSSLDTCDTEIPLGSILVTRPLSNRTLRNIVTDYHSNYSGLKNYLKVPPSMNFEIYSLDGEYKMEQDAAEDINILAKKYTLEVLYETGEIVNKEFIFRVW